MCEKNRLIQQSLPERYVINSLTLSFHVWKRKKRGLLINKTIGSRHAKALQSRRFSLHDEIANASTRATTMYRSANARCGNAFKCLDPLNDWHHQNKPFFLDIHTHAVFLLFLNTLPSWRLTKSVPRPFFAARKPRLLSDHPSALTAALVKGALYRDE